MSRTRSSLAAARRAFTLLELLIAMGLTLILVIAIAQFYAFVGDTVRDGRAIIEMGGLLRSATTQLRSDLNSVTVRPLPPIDPSQGSGFIEIVEGPATDIDVNGNLDLTDDGTFMLGDGDDILSMTIRATGAPFVGRYCRVDPNNPNIAAYDRIESNLAEVVWFTTFKDLNGNRLWSADEPRYLVRRVLLIRPDLAANLQMPTGGLDYENIFHHNDISAHLTASGWVANSLSDLTQRENRFIHTNLVILADNGLRAATSYLPNPVHLDQYRIATFPNDNDGDPNNQLQNATTLFTLQYTRNGNFFGEDRVLDNLLSFDVRVYDPQVPLVGDKPDVVGVIGANDTPATTDDALAVLQPGDPGYIAAILPTTTNEIAGYGAYVDLWYNRGLALDLVNASKPVNQWPNSAFAWAPDVHNLPAAYHPAVGLNARFRDSFGFHLMAAWDSWSTAYENDGFDQDGMLGADQGTDGLDSDNANGVDDAGEFETHPPYPVWGGDNHVDDDLDNTEDEATGQPTDEGNIVALPRVNLRGIQVRVRMYEPGTRQTRQATVIADFLLE